MTRRSRLDRSSRRASSSRDATGPSRRSPWLATSLAYEQEDLGRVDQELALATESLDAASRAGDDELVATARECLTWAHIVRGEHELALLEHERAGSRARRQENRGYSANLDAVLGWADDPTRAYKELAAAFERLTPENQAFASVARGLARMALRLADHQGLASATGAYLEATADRTGPIMVIRHRWFRGLAMDPSGSEVEAAAEELAAAGYRGNAAEALADAALLGPVPGAPAWPESARLRSRPRSAGITPSGPCPRRAG